MNLPQFILDLVLPRFCVGCSVEGSWFCANCSSRLVPAVNFTCAFCSEASPAGRPCHKHRAAALDQLVSAGYYHDPILRAAIQRFKYHGAQELARPLGQFLIRTTQTFAALFPREALVIPVPLHWQRKNERGFNQTELLAKIVSASLRTPLRSDLLVRFSSADPQVQLSDPERRRNLCDAFAVTDPRAVENQSIILVDDVSTTGATLEIAARVLKNAGAKQVIGLALARG
ncbi:ComF family protein [Candidatus Uhrbacteria bacterium]|nr:ComF family protein [Candidatus Uhrbacteria bacterium]